jgi:hypothetical protein
LLPNGKVLVTGGWTGNGGVNLAELYDGGLGFTPLWQPHLTNRTSPLVPGGNLVLTGFRFRGVSSSSSGRDKDSPTDFPLVQLRSLESERTAILMSTNLSTNSFTSLPVRGLLPGWTMATVFVNGIPSTASLIEISAPVATSQPVLVMEKSAPASVRLHWQTNAAGFMLQSNTNLATTYWTTVSPLPGPTGTNIVLTNLPAGDQRFYRLFKP